MLLGVRGAGSEASRLLRAHGISRPPADESLPTRPNRCSAALAARRALPPPHAVGSMCADSWLHMTWGAINELMTLSAYYQLKRRSSHPVLHQMLDRIIQDERRHFAAAASARPRLLVPAARDWFEVVLDAESNGPVAGRRSMRSDVLFGAPEGRPARRQRAERRAQGSLEACSNGARGSQATGLRGWFRNRAAALLERSRATPGRPARWAGVADGDLPAARGCRRAGRRGSRGPSARRARVSFSRWLHGSHRRRPTHSTSPTRKRRPTRSFRPIPRVTTLRRPRRGRARSRARAPGASIASASISVRSWPGLRSSEKVPSPAK